MFQFLKSLKTKLLSFWHYFSPLIKEKKNSLVIQKTTPILSLPSSSSQSKKDFRVNRDRSVYNQKAEVKAKKNALYLKNKEKYYANKKRKRDLDKELKNSSPN